MTIPLKHQKNGFTIVELIIVIAVIGILAAMSLVSYNGVQGNARDKVILSDAESVATEVVRYGVNHEGTYGSAVVWSSSGAANVNIPFIPSPGNVIAVTADSARYCIRVYNPNSSSYKTVSTAYKKESAPGVCSVL